MIVTITTTRRFSWLHLKEVAYWVTEKSLAWKRRFRRDESERHFEHVLHFAAAAVLESGPEKYQLAIHESGLMLFVPIEAKVGDILCQPTNSDILLIARVDKKRSPSCFLKLIGRGVNIFDTLIARESGNLCCGGGKLSPTPNYFTFNLSLDALLRLSVSSEVPSRPIWRSTISS